MAGQVPGPCRSRRHRCYRSRLFFDGDGLWYRRRPVSTAAVEIRPGHFASRRFDRDASGPLHLHSLAGVLEADPDGASVSYREYLRVAQFLTRDIRRVEEAFRRMVFNVVAYNRDDHARNHAFLLNAAGRWSLSPAFDLTFSPGPDGEHYLAVAGQGKAITHEHLIAEDRAAGLPLKLLKTCIDEMQSAVAEWRKFASAAGLTAARAAEIQTAIKIGSAI
jgi:serine/threonine-protein kinase HipA